MWCWRSCWQIMRVDQIGVFLTRWMSKRCHRCIGAILGPYGHLISIDVLKQWQKCQIFHQTMYTVHRSLLAIKVPHFREVWSCRDLNHCKSKFCQRRRLPEADVIFSVFVGSSIEGTLESDRNIQKQNLGNSRHTVNCNKWGTRIIVIHSFELKDSVWIRIR